MLIAIVILMFSVIFHEVAHGYVARLNGDSTAKDAGRLTLNPISHVDPVGTILLPAILILMKAPILFGWAKPVPFNPMNFKNRRLGIFTVGIAGPAANVLLAVFCSLGLRLSGPGDLFVSVFFYGTSINLFLALFNLLPIPPLDGSRALGVLLPRRFRAAYFSLERWGFVIIVVLLYTGILHKLILPVYTALLKGLLGFNL
jgi:Zn-dependent protease